MTSSEGHKRVIGQVLARGWRLTLPVTAAVARRVQAAPLDGLAYHLSEALGPTARYQVARLRFGLRIIVDLQDHVQRPMYFIGEWEPSTTALIRRFAQPGWSFLDIGANAGYFTLLAADAGGASSRVVAVEPNPPVHALLAATVALNGLETTIVVRGEACGSSAGTAVLNVSGHENSGRSTLVPGRLRDEHTSVEVEVTTVDELCAELDFRPTFVKVDAEGYEYEIVRGMSRLLEEYPPQVIVLEVSTFDGIDEPRRLVDLMAERSYRPYRIGAGGSLSDASRSTFGGIENLAFLHRPGGSPPSSLDARSA